VTWAFPSSSRTGRARRRGIVLPTALSRNATLPKLRHHLDALAALCPFCSIALCRSSSLPRVCLIAIKSLYETPLTFLPFELFLYFHSGSSTLVISIDLFSSIPACPDFLAVFFGIALAPRTMFPYVVQPAPNSSVLLTKTWYSPYCLNGVRDDVRGRIEDKCLDTCFDVCVPCCRELHIAPFFWHLT